MNPQQELERLNKWVSWFDDGFEIPVLKKRIGYDPIIGLIPGIGDIITLLFHIIPFYMALKLKVSIWVLARMVVNSAIDIGVGSIPIMGDMFDFFFLAHRRNFKLINSYVVQQDSVTHQSKTYFLFSLIALLLVFASFLVGLSWFIYWIINQVIS